MSDDRPAAPAVQARPWLTGPAKGVLDRAAAAGLLVLLGPVLLVAAGLVKATSRGPALYTQTRVGLGGRPFRILKLRTMTHDAEAGTGATWAVPGDPRVTRVGRLLRKTHLDELPQLVNVLKGEMSLVGPRPERPEVIAAKGLADRVPGYADRLAVRPGVTGLAQVWLPPDVGLDCVRRKLALDVHYIRNAGPWTDLALLACTSVKMVGLSPVPFARLFGLTPADPAEGPAVVARPSFQEGV